MFKNFARQPPLPRFLPKSGVLIKFFYNARRVITQQSYTLTTERKHKKQAHSKRR